LTEQELLAFVGGTFRSIWPLELLLLLRQEPRRPWQQDELVRELRASASAVSQGLVELRRIGLVSVDPHEGHSFAAGSAISEQTVAQLIDLYSRKPRAIMQAILSAPNDRIQTFADAFRLRKDPS
jgi:DNA-binding IclR family transcriptional regulator